MFNKIPVLIAIVFVSGCSMNSLEDYQKSTTDMITTSEQNLITHFEQLNTHITALDTRITQQNRYITQLEKKMVSLNKEVGGMKSTLQEYQRSMANTPLNTNISSNVKVSETSPSPKTQHTFTLGALENVYIETIQSEFVARVDTGATTSSIHAIDVQEFERNGKQWVKFHVSDPNEKEENKKWVEAPIVRYVKIRQSTSEDSERRPVVELWIKIGKIHEKAQFTLADRSYMDYPILIGREFIKDVAFVDVGREFIESKNPQNSN